MHAAETTLVRQFFPTGRLRPYIRYFIISERNLEGEYKVLPSAGAVIGLQYSGYMSTITDDVKTKLNSAEITGLSDSYRVFSSSANIGTLLIYFSATGLTHFAPCPVTDLFNLSLSLEDIFSVPSVRELKERLHFAVTDHQRIAIAERFLISQLNDKLSDLLVEEAARRIVSSNGNLRIRRLAESLFTSQSPLEKRFKNIVGTSPKKFASIVRFSYIIGHLQESKSLFDLSCENDFYDQAHFSKEFKRYTGETPENFRSLLAKEKYFTTSESTSLAPETRVKAVFSKLKG